VVAVLEMTQMPNQQIHGVPPSVISHVGQQKAAHETEARSKGYDKRLGHGNLELNG
jgi:hypothetical protein